MKKLIKKGPGLKDAFSLFLVLFTVLLLSSTLTYLALSGAASIKKDTEREIISLHAQYLTYLDKSIADCILELRILQTQTAGSAAALHDFVTGYASKYISISMAGIKGAGVRVSPVKLFGGEITSAAEQLSDSAAEEILFRAEQTGGAGASVSGPDRLSGSRIITIHLPPASLHTAALSASVSLDYLVDSALLLTQLPPYCDVVIADTGGTILSAADPAVIGRQSGLVFPEVPLKNVHAKTVTNAGTVWYRAGIAPPGLQVMLRYNAAHKYRGLKSTLFNMTLFALLILGLVLVLVRVLTGKITASLQKITSVTKKVSGGDFSSRIDLTRSDELGELISAFNKMVDRLAATYRELDLTNRQLQENLDALRRTRAELSRKERLALIGETVARISHEIQNKIGGVSIWVQNLALYAPQDKTISMYTAEMTQSLDSFMHMLQNFKRFYRTPLLNLSHFSLQDVLKRVISRFSNDISSRNLDVIADFAGELPFLRADEELVEVVCVNLLINALYYSPDNGRVEISAAVSEEWLQLYFRDEGPGVREEDRQRLFQPFFTTKTSGSGLGLAIADNIIRAHQGRITLEPAQGRGACFKILLPLRMKDGSTDTHTLTGETV